MIDKGDNSYSILVDEILQIVFYIMNYTSYETIMSIARAQISCVLYSFILLYYKEDSANSLVRYHLNNVWLHLMIANVYTITIL